VKKALYLNVHNSAGFLSQVKWTKKRFNTHWKVMTRMQYILGREEKMQKTWRKC